MRKLLFATTLLVPTLAFAQGKPPVPCAGTDQAACTAYVLESQLDYTNHQLTQTTASALMYKSADAADKAQLADWKAYFKAYIGAH